MAGKILVEGKHPKARRFDLRFGGCGGICGDLLRVQLANLIQIYGNPSLISSTGPLRILSSSASLQTPKGGSWTHELSHGLVLMYIDVLVKSVDLTLSPPNLGGLELSVGFLRNKFSRSQESAL